MSKSELLEESDMKIDIPLDSLGKYVLIPCEIVDVAPHLADLATFVIHRQTHRLRNFPDGWALSNVETGFAVDVADAKTRLGCLEKARIYLGTITRARMMQALEKAKRAD